MQKELLAASLPPLFQFLCSFISELLVTVISKNKQQKKSQQFLKLRICDFYPLPPFSSVGTEDLSEQAGDLSGFKAEIICEVLLSLERGTQLAPILSQSWHILRYIYGSFKHTTLKRRSQVGRQCVLISVIQWPMCHVSAQVGSVGPSKAGAPRWLA